MKIVADATEEKVETIISMLKDKGILIISSGTEMLVEEKAVIVIGHIIHSDLRDTIGMIDATGFAEVVELKASMPAVDKPSSTYLVIRAKSEEHMRKALDVLREVSEKKGLLVVEPIQDQIAEELGWE